MLQELLAQLTIEVSELKVTVEVIVRQLAELIFSRNVNTWVIFTL